MSNHNQNRQCESNLSLSKRKRSQNSRIGSNVEDDCDDDDDENEQPRRSLWNRLYHKIHKNVLGCISSIISETTEATLETNLNGMEKNKETLPQSYQIPSGQNCQLENVGHLDSVKDIEVMMSSSLENELESVLRSSFLDVNQRNDLEMLFQKFFHNHSNNNNNRDSKPAVIKEKSEEAIEFLMSNCLKNIGSSSEASSNGLIPGTIRSTNSYISSDEFIFTDAEVDRNESSYFEPVHKFDAKKKYRPSFVHAKKNTKNQKAAFRESKDTSEVFVGFYEGFEANICKACLAESSAEEYQNHENPHSNSNVETPNKCSICGLDELLNGICPKETSSPKISIEEAIRIPAKIRTIPKNQKTNLEHLVKHAYNFKTFDDIQVYGNRVRFFQTPHQTQGKDPSTNLVQQGHIYASQNEDNQISDSGIETTRTSGLTTQGLYTGAISDHHSEMVAKLKGELSSQNTQSQEISFNIADKDDCLKCLGQIVYKLYSSAMSTAQVNFKDLDSCFTPKEVEISLTIPFKDLEKGSVKGSLDMITNTLNDDDQSIESKKKLSKATSAMVKRTSMKNLVNHDTQVYCRRLENLKNAILTSNPNVTNIEEQKLNVGILKEVSSGSFYGSISSEELLVRKTPRKDRVRFKPIVQTLETCVAKEEVKANEVIDAKEEVEANEEIGAKEEVKANKGIQTGSNVEVNANGGIQTTRNVEISGNGGAQTGFKVEVKATEGIQTSTVPSRADAFTMTLGPIRKISPEDCSKPKYRKLKLLRHYACQSPDFIISDGNNNNNNVSRQNQMPKEFILNSTDNKTSYHLYYSLNGTKQDTSFLVPEKDSNENRSNKEKFA